MWELLTQKWQIDEHLAGALISRYGGHIYDMVRSLDYLSGKEEDENEALMPLWDGRGSGFVHRCLQWKGQCPEDRERMHTCLRLLAENGFAPLDRYDDPVAEVISQNNVGGVVLDGSLVMDLPREVWKRPDGSRYSHGIVPTKQSMRLVIASLI